LFVYCFLKSWIVYLETRKALLDEIKSLDESLERKDINAEKLKSEETELTKALENMFGLNPKQESQNFSQDVPKTEKSSDTISFTSTDEMLFTQFGQMVSCALNSYSVALFLSFLSLSYHVIHTYTHTHINTQKGSFFVTAS
jgi:hypothetical protein